ncbi:hypothetical protein [Pyrococcus kukulkanii]|uniref:PEGA domain-containing protein n=1 Tax=Pyrococcus kukulkanii TaxID=1609559 RepID=A0ABV4T691_9EURY
MGSYHVVLILIIAAIVSHQVLAWEYELVNSNQATLKDYVTKVVLPTTVVPEQVIAVLDGTTIPRFVQDSRTVWIKVSSLAPGTHTLTIRTDPTVSIQNNPTTVLIFYDDFRTWSGWVQLSGSVYRTVIGGEPAMCKDSLCDPNGGVKRLFTPVSYPVVVEGGVWRNYGAGYDCPCDRIGLLDNTVGRHGYGYGICHRSNGGINVFVDVRTGWSARQYEITSSIRDYYTNSWYTFTFIITSSARLFDKYVVIVGNAKSSYTGTIGQGSYIYPTLSYIYVFGGRPYFVRYLAVYRYYPSVYVGTVTKTATIVGIDAKYSTLLTDTTVTFTNPTTVTLSVKDYKPETVVASSEGTYTVELVRSVAYLVLIIEHTTSEVRTYSGDYMGTLVVTLSKEGFYPVTRTYSLTKYTLTDTVPLTRKTYQLVVILTDVDVKTTISKTTARAPHSVVKTITLSAPSYAPETITVVMTAPSTTTVGLTKTLIDYEVIVVDYDEGSIVKTVRTTLSRGTHTLVVSEPSYSPATLELTATADSHTTVTLTKSITTVVIKITVPRGVGVLYYSGESYSITGEGTVTITVERGGGEVVVDGDYVYPTTVRVGFGGTYTLSVAEGVKFGVVTVKEETPIEEVTGFLYRGLSVVKLFVIAVVVGWVFAGVAGVVAGKAEGRTVVRRVLLGFLLAVLLLKLIDFIVAP